MITRMFAIAGLVITLVWLVLVLVGAGAWGWMLPLCFALLFAHLALGDRVRRL